MRILYLSQYFPPETGATQTRSFEMAKHLVKQGHKVTVIANVPNHPSGIIHPEFQGVWYRRVFMEEGIDVIYVRVSAFEEKTFKKRIIFYLSYMFAAMFAGIFACREKYDCIYATSPPLFVGGAGLFLHWVKRIPLFFEVRDPWPQAAVELGLVRSGMAIRLATVLEEACYRFSKKIVVVTDTVRKMLTERGIDNEKIVLIPNGATVDTFKKSRTLGDQIRQDLGMEDKFIILHAGNIGVAQGLYAIVDAARILENEPRYQFVFVGGGPLAAELKEKALSMGLSNIRFLGLRPRGDMPGFFSATDTAVVSSKALEVFLGMKPVKMFDAWSCETPVLLGMKGEARQTMDETGGGLYYRPEDAKDMVRAIREMDALGKAAREKMGKKARAFVVKYYSRKSRAMDLERLLLKSIDVK